MFSVSGRRGLLAAVISMSTACSDLSLPLRRPSSEASETVSQPASPTTPKRAPKVSRIPPEVEASSFAEVRRTLRELVAAEEGFFAENGSYTSDLSNIRIKPDTAIRIRFLWLSRDGWAASGTHADLPGRNCVIFVGQRKRRPTTLKYGRLGRLGTPVCDESRTPTQPSPPGTARAGGEPPSKADSAPPDTGNALDVLDPRVVMKVDLRNLAHSQETFFAMQGFFAKRTENLALQYLWHRGVQVKILSADAGSWSAKAVHAKSPGKSCVIWFGTMTERPRTDAQHKVERRPGVPACDD